MEIAHNKHHTAIGHNLLTIPVELRLKIYEYLLPLDTPCGDLRGIVMSCRLVKEEMYYEMKKCVDGMQTTLEQRWPFDKGFNVVFPGRLFKAKDVIIDVPYLPARIVYPLSEGVAAWNQLSRKGGLSLPVMRMTLRIGDVPGKPKFSPPWVHLVLSHYMRKLSLRYLFISGCEPGIAKEREVRYKDGHMAFREKVTLLIKSDHGEREEYDHPQDVV